MTFERMHLSSEDLRWNFSRSPFVSVLHTNYAPSIEELIHLEALLTEPKLELAELESEVDRVQNLLDNLSHKKEIVQKYVDAHRALISPMRRLPAETLSEIFVQCLPEERYAVRDLTQAPLLLTTISRDWRQTAINTPALWQSLHIYIPSEMSSRAVKRRALGSALWLERSGSLPISISLSLGTLEHWQHATLESATDRHVIMETLLKFSSRVKELVFTGSFDEMGHLDSLTSVNFPILNMFCAQSTIFFLPSEPTELPFTSLVRRMPALKKLKINGFIRDFKHHSQLELDWENLTELTLQPAIGYQESALSPREILNILARTRHLQTLTVLIDISDWVLADGNAVVNLPKMQDMRLILRGNITPDEADPLAEPTFVPIFFRSFLCPSLKRFSVQSSQRGLVGMLSALPSQNLETLSLNISITTDELLKCLSLVPSLRFLEIGDRGILVPDGGSIVFIVDDLVLMRLVSDAQTGTLCPHLQHIRIILVTPIYKKVTGITYHALLAFLESRIQTLQSCDVFFAEPQTEPTKEDLQRMKMLVNSGIKIRVRYGKIPPRHSNDQPDIRVPWPSREWSSLSLSWNAPSPAYLEMEGDYGTGIII